MATSSAQMTIFSNMDFWTKIISTFSSALMGVYVMLAGGLGFLIWKQNDMRKEAEKDMKKVKNLVADMDKLYKNYSKLIKKAKETLTTAKTLMENVSEKTKKTDKLIKQLKEKGKEVEDISEKIEEIRNDINRGTASLATVSELLPSDQVEQVKGQVTFEDGRTPFSQDASALRDFVREKEDELKSP